MILLEHMAAHSQSAAVEFVPNGLKINRISLVGKGLDW